MEESIGFRGGLIQYYFLVFVKWVLDQKVMAYVWRGG